MAEPSIGQIVVAPNEVGSPVLTTYTPGMVYYQFDTQSQTFVVRWHPFVATITPSEPDADTPLVVEPLTHVLDCGCTISRYISRCPMHDCP